MQHLTVTVVKNHFVGGFFCNITAGRRIRFRGLAIHVSDCSSPKLA